MERVPRKPIRQRVTGAAKTVLHRSGAIALARRASPAGSHLPVIRYHSVSEGADYCPPSISVPPWLFERQIAYLVHHYEVITVERAVSCLRDGRPFPARAAAITFDDGYRDNVMRALPILQRHGASAMFYVASGPAVARERFWVGWLQRAVLSASDPRAIAEAFGLTPRTVRGRNVGNRQALIDDISVRINRVGLDERAAMLARVEDAIGLRGRLPDGCDFMMDARDLRTLRGAGMEIGSHTVSHPVLTGLSMQEARFELERSREMLEGVLDSPVSHLAYPNGPQEPGNFDSQTMALARAAGYRSAATSERGSVARGSDPMALPRHGVNYLLGISEFAFKIEEHRFAALLME